MISFINSLLRTLHDIDNDLSDLKENVAYQTAAIDNAFVELNKISNIKYRARFYEVVEENKR